VLGKKMNKALVKRLAELRAEEKKVVEQIEATKPNLQFRCGCGALHKFRDCLLISKQYYTAPSGCMGGDYWSFSEAQIVCPKTDVKNRLMWDSKYSVPYDYRDHHEYDAEAQFIRQFRSAFKEVTIDYDKDKRSWWNNRYIDNNHEKFGLHVKGFNYAAQRARLLAEVRADRAKAKAKAAKKAPA
jgi:hypothetical protein